MICPLCKAGLYPWSHLPGCLGAEINTVITAIEALAIGDATAFSHFSVKRVSRFDYFLRDDLVRVRARWGNLKQICEDVRHCVQTDTLPLPDAGGP